MTSLFKHIATVTVACLFAASLLLLAAPAAAETMELSAANGVFENLESGLNSIRQGPLTILISSPENRLVVHQNRLTLTPTNRADGGIEAKFEASIEGAGLLVAEVQGGPDLTRFEDQVRAPKQWLRADGFVRLEPSPSGYRLTFLEAITPAVSVEIDSQLAGQMLQMCRMFEAIPLLGAMSCDGLAESLAVVKIPMPAYGTRFFLRGDLLSAEERSFFDRHITTHNTP